MSWGRLSSIGGHEAGERMHSNVREKQRVRTEQSAGGERSKPTPIGVNSCKRVSFCVTMCVFDGLDVRKAASFLGPFSFLSLLKKKNHLETGTIFCSNGRCP